MSDAGIQSSLHAADGSGAALIHELGLVLYVGAALIFLVVISLVMYGILSNARRAEVRHWIIGGGVVFPIVTLSALLVYSLSIGNALDAHAPAGALRVHVTGKQWWWEVRYEIPGSATAAVLANELHVPVGQPVELLLTTSDVIHSFWAPPLAGKVDMIPGRTNRLLIQAQKPGVYRGQCAEYCGGQHALMAFYLVAEPQERFRSWLARQAQPISLPGDPSMKLGYDLFFRGGCAACHAIRGTPAIGEMGPDLTHVGDRRSLAAGVLGNHIGTMAGWIAGAQDVKPGNHMPSVNAYTGRELRAVSAWLESLE
jgi:cytochrome c oxidase subunit II